MSQLATAADLEAEWKYINDAYAKLGSQDWTERAKLISLKAWSLFSTTFHIDWRTHDMCAVVARSIVFWTKEQKLRAIDEMWHVATNTTEIEWQARYGSIMEVITLGMDRDEVRPLLVGIDSMDRSRNYGEGLAIMIRRFQK